MASGQTDRMLFDFSSCLLEYVELLGKDRERGFDAVFLWSDINPVVFESLLNETIDIEYEHGDLQSAFFVIEKFLKAWSDLWQMLASLDYIGRHKDNIVIGERNHSESRGVSTEWTPFDHM